MDKNSVISQLNRQDIDRLRGYRERLDFYHGRQWLGRGVAVTFFDEHNPKEAVVVAVYS